MRTRDRGRYFLSETLFISAGLLAVSFWLIDSPGVHTDRGYLLAAGCATAGLITYALSLRAGKKQ